MILGALPPTDSVPNPNGMPLEYINAKEALIARGWSI